MSSPLLSLGLCQLPLRTLRIRSCLLHPSLHEACQYASEAYGFSDGSDVLGLVRIAAL